MARLNHDFETDSGRDDNRRQWSASRIWGVGEDPLTWWSFTLLKLGGFRLRVHTLLVPVWVGIELLAWLPRSNAGPLHIFSAIGSLLLIAIIRELGRGLFARWLGEGTDSVVLWPLGGLNSVAGPYSPRPLLAESGGLLVNLALLPALAATAIAVGLPAGSLLINPAAISPGVQAETVIQAIVWWAYFINLLMLVLNACVPMVPLDTGRLLSAWLRKNKPESMEAAVRVGFVSAGVLFVVSIALGQSQLLGVAVLGAAATWLELRRYQFMAAQQDDFYVPVVDEDDHPRTPVRPPVRERAMTSHPAATRGGPVVTNAGALDAVLEKISREGLANLTEAEKAVLARETERRRRG